MNILQKSPENTSASTGSHQANLKLLRLSFLFTFIFGFIAHGFQFLNFNASHDWAIEIYSDSGLYLYQIALGRLFEPLFRIFLSADVSTPWLTGLLALGLISLAVYFVSRLFDLDKTYEVLLVSGILVTNQTVTSLSSTYITWFGADMLAMLLAVVTAYLWNKGVAEKRYALLPAAALVLAFSLGFYQSFLSVCIVLIMFKCILMFLEDRKFSDVLRDGLLGIAVLAVGSILYFIFMQIICHIADVPIIEDTYNTVSNLWKNTEPLQTRLLGTYGGLIKRLVGSRLISAYPAAWLRAVNLTVFVLCFGLLIYVFVKKRPKLMNIVGALLLVVLIPFAANLVRFLNTTVHDLMIYAYWLLFLIPLLLLHHLFENADSLHVPKCVRSVSQIVICILLGIVIYDNIQTANVAYLAKQSEYDATLSCMTSVMYDVEHMPGYVEGETPIYIIGSPTSAFEDLPYRKHLSSLTGLTSKSAVTYDYGQYLLNIMQKKPYLLNASYDPDDIALREAITVSQQLDDMAVYPNEGYVRYIYGTVVVRFPW